MRLPKACDTLAGRSVAGTKSRWGDLTSTHRLELSISTTDPLADAAATPAAQTDNLARILQSAGIGRWHWSSERQRFSADETGAALLRLQGSEWNAESFWSAFSSEGAGGAERFRRFISEGDNTESFEWEARVGADAEARWLKLHGTIIRDGSEGLIVDGILIQKSTYEEDAAAMAVSRSAMQDQENRFRMAIDMIPQIVWSTLPDGYHDYYNSRWYEFTGTTPGSTDGEGWADLFHPEDQKRAWPLWRHSLETGEPYEVEYRLRAADGTYRWTLGRALPIRDENGAIIRWFGTCTDIDEKKRLLEGQELLSHELSHRIKNIFAVIASLIGLSARIRPEAAEFAADIRDRISALGRAHNYARPHSDASRPFDTEASLFGLLRQILAPYPALAEGRIRIEGSDPAITDRAATPIALLFHELATNAVKYGSLSTPEGALRIESRIDDQGTVHLRWTESGGPPLEGEPEQPGFGTRLAEMSVERQLGGTMKRSFERSGFVFEATIPSASLSLER